ncbi:hypothetical protein GCM10011402_30780 [Paracoccus acridae]|uniref:Uncharacterized protein n=1 Tax=Paracoccus acridae TaxID=1795310 RepID=A0ABQ1VMA6_9RHOB|nr:hypothetical protein [Paracoccus acridae]GGF75896.1 hypothetical protein GCM10011402_30780 [Paracoccus acridae]
MTGLQLAEAIQVRHPDLPVIHRLCKARPRDHPGIAPKLGKPCWRKPEALGPREDPEVVPFRLPAI